MNVERTNTTTVGDIRSGECFEINGDVLLKTPGCYRKDGFNHVFFVKAVDLWDGMIRDFPEGTKCTRLKVRMLIE